MRACNTCTLKPIFVLSFIVAAAHADEPSTTRPETPLPARYQAIPAGKRMRLQGIVSGGQDHNGALAYVCVLPDGKRAVAATCPGRDDVERWLRNWSETEELMPRYSDFGLWNLETGKELCIFHDRNEAVTALALSPDGKQTLSGTVEGSLLLWDVESGRLI